MLMDDIDVYLGNQSSCIVLSLFPMKDNCEGKACK